MKKLFVVFFALLLLFSFALSLASAQKSVYYFSSATCPHCINVANSGVMDRVANISGVILEKLDISPNSPNIEKLDSYIAKTGKAGGIPFAVLICDNKTGYLMGDTPIIDNLEKEITTCEFSNPIENQNNDGNNSKPITLFSIIIASLVDSINPCAFGVLIFLMISLLSMGSSKRALKAGLLYTFMIFLTYFLSGLGLFEIIQSLSSVASYIHIGVGALVFIFGLIEIKDFFWYGKGISLKIPASTKPLIERTIQKGTIPAIIFLGVIVSLFELPCTGGVYLAILTMMSQSQSFSLFYLLLYNLIFILPLIVITLIIYKGTNPEKLQNWTNQEKKWMRLVTGFLMIALALYLLWPYL
jgi:cytochrome c biogenesis protein CcdA